MNRATTAFAITAVLLLSGCAGDERAEAAKVAKTGARASPDAAGAVRGLAGRVRNQVARSTSQLRNDGLLVDATAQRSALRWRLAAEEVCLEAIGQPNLVIGLCWLWHWESAGATWLARDDTGLPTAQREVMRQRMLAMAGDARALAVRLLGERSAAILEADILRSAAAGELYTMATDQRQGALSQVLSATRIESVLGIAMSPFDALSGVDKGANALDDGVRTAQRATDLLNRYPQVWSLQLQLAALDMAEQPGPRQMLADSHDVVAQLRELPTRLRTEAAALLAESATASSQINLTLRDTKAAAEAIGQAADAIEGGILALDTFVTNAQGPAKPATAAASEPFRITDYKDTAAAIAQTVAELRLAIAELQQAATSPALAAAGARVDATIDHVTWRVVQLLLLAALLVTGLLVLRRRLR